ncbi:MAG: beta-N-acetylhexosaminidase [Clostridia bacterium]
MNFDNLGIMMDCSRNAIMTVTQIEKFIDIISKMGYTNLQLYTEDTFEVNNEPYFGYLRGRYSKSELKQIDEYAKAAGVELIACVQTLAHLESIMRWAPYMPISDNKDILMVDDERTYTLIDNIFMTLSECFTSKRVNIGMDEAHMVGLGRYLDKYGYQDRFEILIRHLGKVANIAKKYGFKLMMWSDMFFKLVSGGNYYDETVKFSQELIKKIPQDIDLIYWDYYSVDDNHYENMMNAHKQLANNIWFAGGAWTWTGFTPHNEFAIATINSGIRMCKKCGIKNIFITMWGDNGGECSYFSALPALMSAAMTAQGIEDEEAIKAKFYEIVGESFDNFMKLDLPCKIGNAQAYENPDKYMLYNDLFLGELDSTVADGDKDVYKTYAKTLKDCVKNSKWDYLFDSASALCEVLYIKYDLGVVTRKAYKEGDKEKLIDLAYKDYNLLIKRIENFYTKFKTLWSIENKPNGFDVQDIRLGGLLMRVKNCRERLLQYVDGAINKIDELEEELLDAFGQKEFTKSPTSINFWSMTVTPNNI